MEIMRSRSESVMALPDGRQRPRLNRSSGIVKECAEL
jgi:hypothetical protein